MGGCLAQSSQYRIYEEELLMVSALIASEMLIAQALVFPQRQVSQLLLCYSQLRVLSIETLQSWLTSFSSTRRQGQVLTPGAGTGLRLSAGLQCPVESSASKICWGE